MWTVQYSGITSNFDSPLQKKQKGPHIWQSPLQSSLLLLLLLPLNRDGMSILTVASQLYGKKEEWREGQRREEREKGRTGGKEGRRDRVLTHLKGRINYTNVVLICARDTHKTAYILQFWPKFHIWGSSCAHPLYRPGTNLAILGKFSHLGGSCMAYCTPMTAKFSMLE